MAPSSRWSCDFFSLQKKKHKKHKHKEATEEEQGGGAGEQEGEDGQVSTDELLKRSEVTCQSIERWPWWSGRHLEISLL